MCEPMKTFFTIRHFAGKNIVHFAFAKNKQEAFDKFSTNFLFRPLDGKQQLILAGIKELNENNTIEF